MRLLAALLLLPALASAQGAIGVAGRSGISDRSVASVLEKAFKSKPDAVVLISCSGESPSVVNAALKARDMGLKVVTFTGRDPGNALKAQGDVNFHVPSHAYNVVENLHAVWLTATIDLIIGKAEYETRALV